MDLAPPRKEASFLAACFALSVKEFQKLQVGILTFPSLCAARQRAGGRAGGGGQRL